MTGSGEENGSRRMEETKLWWKKTKTKTGRKDEGKRNKQEMKHKHRKRMNGDAGEGNEQLRKSGRKIRRNVLV